jgi:hypothetical protein
MLTVISQGLGAANAVAETVRMNNNIIRIIKFAFLTYELRKNIPGHGEQFAFQGDSA